MNISKQLLITLLSCLPMVSPAQSVKRDTVKGVVIYTGYSNLRYLPKGDYHTYTMGATEIIADTGVVAIRTEFGYIDLKKNYTFIPLNKLQPARLKRKP